MSKQTERDAFRSRWGFILACIGSAVGMGNIWRFPYLVSAWGGMTFLLPYFLFVLLIGSTGIIGEMALGRSTRSGPIGAFGQAAALRGSIPKSVENLLVIARVRALAHKCYVTEILVKEKEVKLTMYQKAKINVGGIPDLVNSYGGALKLVPGEAPVFHYVERKPKGITIEDMLFKAEEILKGLRKLRM